MATDLPITEIRYERNINLGNYETARLGVSIHVNPSDDADAIVKTAAEWIWNKLQAERSERR